MLRRMRRACAGRIASGDARRADVRHKRPAWCRCADPAFTERVDCLRLAYAEEYETSVSCEPMLDVDRGALIKWKDSIKQVVGLDRPTCAGLDV